MMIGVVKEIVPASSREEQVLRNRLRESARPKASQIQLLSALMKGTLGRGTATRSKDLPPEIPRRRQKPFPARPCRRPLSPWRTSRDMYKSVHSTAHWGTSHKFLAVLGLVPVLWVGWERGEGGGSGGRERKGEGRGGRRDRKICCVQKKNVPPPLRLQIPVPSLPLSLHPLPSPSTSVAHGVRSSRGSRSPRLTVATSLVSNWQPVWLMEYSSDGGKTPCLELAACVAHGVIVVATSLVSSWQSTRLTVATSLVSSWQLVWLTEYSSDGGNVPCLELAACVAYGVLV